VTTATTIEGGCFCGDCGTPLTYRHDLGWVKFGDGLPVFREFRPRKSNG
jgi:hypothetical protein